MARNRRAALETLIHCGVPRVLTSGGAHTALQVIGPGPEDQDTNKHTAPQGGLQQMAPVV
jgi:hypothetical protein